VPSIESFGRDVTENGLNFKTFKIDVPSFKEKYPFQTFYLFFYVTLLYYNVVLIHVHLYGKKLQHGLILHCLVIKICGYSNKIPK
jgi:hypothetical protein